MIIKQLEGTTIPFYWIALVVAIGVALCSGKIDMAVNANSKLKKRLMLLCAVMAITSVTFIIKSLGVIM